MLHDDILNLKFGNAAGWIKNDGDSLLKLLRAPVSEITFGSVTIKPSEGNTGQVFWTNEETGMSLNSLGLPNLGLEASLEVVKKIAPRVHAEGKRLRTSIAGFSPEEFETLAGAFAEGDSTDEIEINLGCPNIHASSGQKPIFAYDLEITNEVLKRVRGAVRSRKSLAVKVSPYSDPLFAAKMGDVLQKYFHIGDAVVVCNTFPNIRAFDKSGRSAIDAKAPDGTSITSGGMAGKPLKVIALSNVRAFRRALPKHIRIIGVGGIENGHDAWEYGEAGAGGIQVGTAYFKHDNPKIFSDILEGYVVKANLP